MRRSDLISLSVAGLGTAAAGGLRRAEAQTLEKLQLVAIPSDALTPLYYGLQTGAFTKAGIDLQITAATSGTAATTAVIAGSYDIANTSLLPVMTAHLHNIPITIVAPQAVYTPANPFSLLQIATDAAYKSGADLNGQTVACAALNDLNQVSISAWVDKTGGDSRTLKFVEIPNGATDEALVAHRVAAGNLLEPLLDASLAAGHTKTLGDSMGAIAPRFMFAAYVARPDWAKAHADLLRRFVRVAGAAATYTNAHPEATAAMMADITKIPVQIMQRMKRVACATALDPGMVQPLIDAAVKYKNIPQGFAAKDLFFTES